MSEEMQPHEVELPAGPSTPSREFIGAAEDSLPQAEQRGNNRDGGKSPADEPLSAVAVEADKIATIKAQIVGLWPHGRDRRIVIGRLLIQLHDLLSKQGSGCFMKTIVEELHIPYTTAVGYMAEAREFDNPSCYEIRNNEPTADVVENPEAGDDVHAQAVEAAKAAEREAREQAEREGRFSTLYRVDFSPVSPQWRDRCKARVREVGITEAFARFCYGLFSQAFCNTQGTPAGENEPGVVSPAEEAPVATAPAEVSDTGLGTGLFHETEARASAEEALVPCDPAVDKIREQTPVEGGAREAKVY